MSGHKFQVKTGDPGRPEWVSNTISQPRIKGEASGLKPGFPPSSLFFRRLYSSVSLILYYTKKKTKWAYRGAEDPKRGTPAM